MSGFDPDWLALRERADENARAAATERLETSIAPRDSALRVVDLGAGSGRVCSNEPQRARQGSTRSRTSRRA